MRGKSSQTVWRQTRSCKPHLVQERGENVDPTSSIKSLEPFGNDWSRQMTVKYRTRLTD